MYHAVSEFMYQSSYIRIYVSVFHFVALIKPNSYTYFQKSSAIHKGTLTLQHYNIIANFKRAKSAQQCKISVVLTLKIQIPPSTLHKPKAHKTPLRRCGCHMNVLCKRIKYLSLQ